MAIGSRIRALFGPYEAQIANLWRRMFLDLDEWTKTMRQWVIISDPAILEVGCGEGYSTARLAKEFPNSSIDAIDISNSIGRLYDGPLSLVRFHKCFLEEFLQKSNKKYDLIILSDVLHHVPINQRASLINSIKHLLKINGIFAFKDWYRNRSFIYYAAYISDRWLTGDKISYPIKQEVRILMESMFGINSIIREGSISPWKNNFYYCIQNA